MDLSEVEGQMKKVIEGKLYNTETAERIATWSNHYFQNDFHFMEETLYRTRKGNWFVYGEGGALSVYAQPCGNGSCGGADIRCLSRDDAATWLEEHDCVDELERYFSDVLEEA
jgi:hypothetical protein